LSRKTLAVVRWREAISIGGVCELAVVEKLRMIVDKQEESDQSKAGPKPLP
jgi:hypothetical protein